jgi:transketolase
MRKTLSDLLVQAAANDPCFLLLTGDHGYALFDCLRAEKPDRFVNCGVAEQNMVGVAAGLAKAEMRPVVYGLAAFIPIRVLEQIKIDLCLAQLPVVMLGDGAGFVYSSLGSSHQCFEDIAALRALPHITIMSPSDRHELVQCFEAVRASQGPSYIRLCKADLGDVHADGEAVRTGDWIFPVIAKRQRTICLATGSMVRIAQRAIERRALPVDLHSIARLKPLDPAAILDICRNRDRIVVAEEHSIFGGLGSIVSEAIAGKITADLRFLGIRDKFSGECGTYQHLLHFHGLDEDSVLEALAENV